MPKEMRKKYGQFFTGIGTARYMASLFNLPFDNKEISLLDAGAGSGILSIALAERLLTETKATIHVTCYENDDNIYPLLQSNLDEVKRSSNNRFSYTIFKENYILSQQESLEEDLFKEKNMRQYDMIIGNPPYKKIAKEAPEAKVLPFVCYGAPNLYFLFASMGIMNLKPNSEMVYIIPRSWTSGAYFEKFRDFLFYNCVLTDIHLFESRNKVFDSESVLQETIIIKLRKSLDKPSHIRVTSSSTSDFSDVLCFEALYETVVSKNKYVYLITCQEDAEVLSRINKLPKTLPDMAMKMKTGLIVDFRTREVLRNELEEDSYPLLYSQHIKDGRVVWPLGKEGEVIKTTKKSYLQENSNFLMVKRFTSKEEKRRLQCGIFLKQRYEQYPYISTQNKINFIQCDSPCITYGLYVLLNSSLYDSYYRILNGSTQVNSTEINQMPIPERPLIEEMGRELMHHDLSEMNCNKIVDKWIN
ncbi:MAG: Eco57I restriction-modification methylase domain-containing protein [Bacteroidaceae bacterium]